MKDSDKKRQSDSFELKTGSCPVNGMNTYSVFKNGVLVFMMDGDRPSVFRPEEVEVITDPENTEVRVYRVRKWLFTGGVSLSAAVKQVLPKGCLVCLAEGKMVK